MLSPTVVSAEEIQELANKIARDVLMTLVERHAGPDWDPPARVLIPMLRRAGDEVFKSASKIFDGLC